MLTVLRRSRFKCGDIEASSALKNLPLERQGQIGQSLRLINGRRASVKLMRSDRARPSEREAEEEEEPNQHGM